jgi:uncharacterized RDD family membrane protein YckC
VTQFIPPSSSLRGHYAGFVTRSIAFAIDLMLVIITQVTVLLFTRLLLDFFGLNALAQALFEPSETTNGSLLITLTRWGFAIFGSSILFAVYVISLWLLVDKTLGQALLGLRVVRTNGRSLSFGHALRRVLGYYVSFFALFIGFLWILIDDRRQGWHDKMADTVVVYDWEARLGKRLREWLARRQESRHDASIVSITPAETTIKG